MANYDNFMKTIAGFNLTSSNTPLDGRMVVELDEDIKLVPFPYVGQIIYSHESKRFFIVKSLKDGWQDVKTGEFFDEDPQRPVEEVRMKKNSLVDEFEPINKVDKEEGKSLIADSEIERLLTLKNYDDAELRAAIEELVNSKVDKVEGKSLVDNAEIERLAQVDNYDDSELRGLIDTKIAGLVDGAPEALDTLKELGDALSAHEDAYDALLEVVGNKAEVDHVHDQYLTEHQDISGKVDKEEGKSLVDDVEIARLAQVDNYDDSELRGLVDSKADVNHTHDQYLTEHQDISGKVDKVEGKSLVDDVEIERLAQVNNYDDSEVKERINVLEAINLETKPYIDGKGALILCGCPAVARPNTGKLLDPEADETDIVVSVRYYKKALDKFVFTADQFATLRIHMGYGNEGIGSKRNISETTLELYDIDRVGVIFGGSQITGEIGTVNIVVERCNTISSLLCAYCTEGGAKNVTHNFNLKVKDCGSVSSIFGGTNGYGVVWNSHVEVENTNVGYLVAGGSNGFTRKSEVVLNGGKVEVMQGVNRGILEEAKLVVNNGEVVNFYAAGDTEDNTVTGIQYKAIVELNGGTIQNFFNGNSDSLPFDSSNIEGTISADCTVLNGDTSMLAPKQPEPNEVEELRAALDTKVDKEEGKSLVADTEIARLALVDNYDDSELRGLIDGKADVDHIHDQYLTEHQDISGKVDKEEGKSLVADAEIERLALVDNYDDSELRGLVDGKANADHVHNQYLTEHQDISGKVDKVEGKSLVDDAEIARLALVDNYDDSELRGLIDTKIADLVGGAPEALDTLKELGDALNTHEDAYDALLEVVGNKADANHIHDQYLTEHQDISGKVDKVDGKSLVDDAEIERLAQVDNYDDSELRGLIDRKADADHVHDQYLTEHQDISGKVDKEEGKSLVDDAEIARLAQVDNYDDAELKTLIYAKADKKHSHEQYITLQNLEAKVDKVDGKSLVDDTEIARLALVDNYDDSEVKERVNVLETINLETKPYVDKNGMLVLCGCPAVARPNTGKLLDSEANETDVVVSVRFYQNALDKFVFTADQFANLRICMGYGAEGVGTKRNIVETTLELYDLDRVFIVDGGSQITGEIGTVNIIAERCNYIDGIQGARGMNGGERNIVHNFNVKVKDCGSIDTLFGGANGYAVVWNSHVEVENTNVNCLVAGGSNGFVRKSEVVLNGGNITVMQGVNRGILEEAKLIVNSGNVTNFYAAGDTQDNSVTGTQYKAIVELNGGTIQNFFNGNSNSLPFNSSNIEGTISPDCTVLNGDTSMLVVKQPEAQAPSFAFNENGELVVTINGVSKTFVPKSV